MFRLVKQSTLTIDTSITGHQPSLDIAVLSNRTILIEPRHPFCGHLNHGELVTNAGLSASNRRDKNFFEYDQKFGLCDGTDRRISISCDNSKSGFANYPVTQAYIPRAILHFIF